MHSKVPEQCHDVNSENCSHVNILECNQVQEEVCSQECHTSDYEDCVTNTRRECNYETEQERYNYQPLKVFLDKRGEECPQGARVESSQEPEEVCESDKVKCLDRCQEESGDVFVAKEVPEEEVEDAKVQSFDKYII